MTLNGAGENPHLWHIVTNVYDTSCNTYMHMNVQQWDRVILQDDDLLHTCWEYIGLLETSSTEWLRDKSFINARLILFGKFQTPIESPSMHYIGDMTTTHSKQFACMPVSL